MLRERNSLNLTELQVNNNVVGLDIAKTFFHLYSPIGCAEQREAHRSRLMRLVPRYILNIFMLTLISNHA